MEIYLIRHTKPVVEQGVCYGQSDIDLPDNFEQEAELISRYIPQSAGCIISSPLKRCIKLARFLYPSHSIQISNDLKEINFGNWELRNWNDIPLPQLQAWMNNFVDVAIPNGESYMQLHARVTRCFQNIIQEDMPIIVVTHGGVIRSILSYITRDLFGG